MKFESFLEIIAQLQKNLHGLPGSRVAGKVLAMSKVSTVVNKSML